MREVACISDLEESMVVYGAWLAMQQGQQGVLCVQQHLALTVLLALLPRLVLQAQDLQQSHSSRSHNHGHTYITM